jgi:hypothetical protein
VSNRIVVETGRPVQIPILLLGGIALGVGVILSRHGGLSFIGLGDEATVAASSFDPERSNRAAFLRTHIAKKFWGATVLAAQAGDSMRKLSSRIRSDNPDAAGQAAAIANILRDASSEAVRLALKYDEPWVRNRMKKTNIDFEPEAT